MKNPISSRILPLLPVTTGVLALVFRFWLYSAGMDSKGLLLRSHPGHLLIWLTVGVTLLLTAAAAANFRSKDGFQFSKLSLVGACLAASGLLVTDFTELMSIQDTVNFVSFLLGLAAAVGLVCIGVYRGRDCLLSQVSAGILTVYFMVHMIVQYRQWSGEPQLQNYVFPMLASLFLMLCGYYRTALEQTGKGLRWFVFFNQMALFCSLVSLNTDSWLFYAAMGVWTLTDLPVSRREEA